MTCRKATSAVRCWLVLCWLIAKSTTDEQTSADDLTAEQKQKLRALFGGLGPVMNPPASFLSVSARSSDESDSDDWWRGHQSATDPKDLVPEQIHISLGDNISEMIIMFATKETGSSAPQVYYGTDRHHYDHVAQGRSSEFYDGNWYGISNHHRVKLKELEASTTYYYQVEYNGHRGVPYSFTTMTQGQDWSPEFIVFGDLGRKGGSPTLRALRQEAHSGRHTAFIHSGDFAYNFHDEDGQRGDNFMKRIQDIAAWLPYMTCPGNHELYFDFSHYKHRFSMPHSSWPIETDGMWYSFDVANAHFISYSTEVYFSDNDAYAGTQYSWLENDLKQANAPENRTLRPWIIAFGHRPMYCSNLDRDDCTTFLSKIRMGLESLFYEYGVDIILEAHEHSYERLFPVYDGQVTNCDYVNPLAPTHIIGGAAGCNERHGLCADVVLGPRGAWSAFRSWLPGLNGYGRLKIFNNTHVQWQQVLGLTGQVMDTVIVVQEHHGPYSVPYSPDNTTCPHIKDWLDVP